MSLIKDKQLYYVDSHQRLSGTHSDFSFYFDVTNEYDYAVVLQANIPKSYYIVDINENTFILNEINLSATITLPIGNYSRNSFKAQLQTSLNASSPNGWSYTVNIPNSSITADTGLYTYTVTGNGGVQPQFIIGNFLGEQLGFDSNTTNTFIGNTLVSVNVVKFQAKDSLFIHSNMCSNGSDDILQEIFGVDNPSFGNIIYQCLDFEAYAKPLVSSNNRTYHFYLTDEDSNPINLNGQNITFTVLLFKKQNVYELLSKVLKLHLLE
jgi:hypothetical protein